MTSYKKVKCLTEAQAAYIAGLIDADGSVLLSKRHKNDNRQVVVSISNTDKALLDYVLDIVGAGQITCKRIISSNHTPSFTYSISNRQSISLLEQTIVYLKTYKRERAKLILDKYLSVTPRNGKYNSELTRKREDFIDKFFALS